MVVEDRVFSGRYRVIALLGEGGIARVYKAVDARLRRVVAIKTLHTAFNDQPQLVARFEREARLAAGLSHPNIIGIYDIATDESGIHYIVMEYVAGETLKRLIGRDAPLPPVECLPILRQLCQALDYAHAHSVIHRDVKPENIFLSESRQVKVGDFGIARAPTRPASPRRGWCWARPPTSRPSRPRGSRRPPAPTSTPRAWCCSRC